MDFLALHKKADEAGLAAAEAASPQKVIAVSGGRQIGGAFPICGFAWVHIAGNTAFGRFAKKELGFRADYPSGLALWISSFGQSYDLKLAYARAYAAVLREAGIEAYGDGRLD